MPVVSVSIPEDMKKKMNELDDINWSAVARKAFEEKIVLAEDMKEVERIARKSKLTEKDAKKIADKINRSASKRFLEMHEPSNRR